MLILYKFVERPSLWRYLWLSFLYLLGTYYIMRASTITFDYRIRCYWFLWSSLQRSCPENRKSGSRCRLQHLVWRCRGRRIHQTYSEVSISLVVKLIENISTQYHLLNIMYSSCIFSLFFFFFTFFNRADLDPIYFCELLKTCPIKDDGDAKIISFTVSPQSGPQGKVLIFLVVVVFLI